jgi:hypothetical protein
MSRRILGNWADTTDPDLRPLAIIALGVLVAELWPHQQGEPEEVAAAGPDGIADALRKRFRECRRTWPYRLQWGHHDAERWARFKRAFSPQMAALGWKRFIETLASDDFPDSRNQLELQSWLSWPRYSEEIARDGSWLSGLIWDRARSRVDSFFVDKEWWGLGYGRTRTTWHWPLRLGFLDDDVSLNLLEAFHRNREWIRLLASPVEVERNGFSCDLLVSPQAVRPTADALLRAKARTTAVALLGSTPFHTLDGAADAARLSEAGQTSAIAYLPGEPSINLIVELLREISHDHPFDTAVYRASRALNSGPPLVLADGSFMRDNRLSVLSETWAERLDRRGSPDRAREVRFLAKSVFESEGGTASNLARFSVEAPMRRVQPRYLQSETWLLKERARTEESVFLELASHQDEALDSGLFPKAKALVAERWHLVTVSVGPLREMERSELPPFPDDQIDWDGGPQELSIVIAAPGCDVANSGVQVAADPRGQVDILDLDRNYRLSIDALLAESPIETASALLSLRPNGYSEHAAFLLRPRSTKDLKARVMVTHGNRILQTAILEARVLDGEERIEGSGEAIRLVPEGIVRADFQDLDDRRVFDLALMVNDTLTGAPQFTAVADQGVWLRDLGEIKAAADRLGSRLSDIVERPEEFGGENSEALTTLLTALAHEGVLIRRRLLDSGLGPVLRADPSRIQVVSARPDEVLPIEFVYHGAAPTPASATICPEQSRALAHGSCGACPNSEAASHVCAVRFWGMRKVIERQLYHAEKAPHLDRVTALTPSLELGRIGRPSIRAFASSDRTLRFPDGPSAIQHLKQRLGVAVPHSPTTSSGQPHAAVHAVETWTDWRNCVRDHAPTLMVLLPHTDQGPNGEVLQIGKDAVLTNAQIDATVVGTKPPAIVVLLGCETASSQVRYANFVASFRHAEAAVVIGTLTPVLGRHAAPVASVLVEQLERYWSEPFRTVTVGDAMAEMRRRLMQRGLPIGFAVVAFGDADWLLGA